MPLARARELKPGHLLDRVPTLSLGYRDDTHQLYFRVGDQGVTAVLADEGAALLRLRAVDKVLAQAADDALHVLSKGLFRAVVVDQVLDDVAGELIDARVDRVRLVDDFTEGQRRPGG
jgi:hypothetical protein